ncbi:transcriptional regulator with XRE-family HTH domain [Hydrogenispora ethanolica]|jgi:transcriptional regulator with XRE-family HTH domain|uniref:Transcriptional regulator with XRE-family HTH domain n=1 Tax=Hydrogenispora ethanolica TaxID=1082276 RepID=A0A4R1QQP4_HYDET|nr:helix-turn-helix transcriptional regulator [Hydrogenispora ethanolica]TCL55737.1 transcriptional regulator with XRE-family HTH domain [Hydrogenispora ethanolica]
MDTIGQRLTTARKNMNLTVNDSAKAIGIAKSNLSRVENDQHQPSIATVMKLARFYGVSTDWILFGDDGSEKDSNENLIYVPDSKLRAFFILLVKMWQEGSQDVRGWIIVQLEKAFPEIALKIKKNK